MEVIVLVSVISFVCGLKPLKNFLLKKPKNLGYDVYRVRALEKEIWEEAFTPLPERPPLPRPPSGKGAGSMPRVEIEHTPTQTTRVCDECGLKNPSPSRFCQRCRMTGRDHGRIHHLEKDGVVWRAVVPPDVPANPYVDIEQPVNGFSNRMFFKWTDSQTGRQKVMWSVATLVDESYAVFSDHNSKPIRYLS